MKIRNLLIALITFFTVVGCFKDKGNYDYVVIPEIKVQIPSYSTMVPGDEVEIIPTLVVPKGYTSEFEYEWSIEAKPIGVTTPTYKYKAAESGKFSVGVTVLDVKTGAKYSNDIDITVNPRFYAGFLVLVEDGENTDMHIINASKILRDKTKPTTSDSMVYKKEYMSIYKNYLDGQQPEGKPLRVTEQWAWEAKNLLGEIALETSVNGKTKMSFYNGGSMKRETFIEQEFTNGELPDNFNPVKNIHSCLDSYILNEDGLVYARRANTNKVFHTGNYDKRIPLWGDTKFSDLIFTYYFTSELILGIEIDPVTKKRNYVGIYENYYSDRLNMVKLTLGSGSDKDFFDVKDEIVFTDYFKDYYSTPSNVVIMKNDLGQYILHAMDSDVERPNFTLKTLAKTNLTTEHNVTDVKGMFTHKADIHVLYFWDDHNLYYYNCDTKVFKIVKSYPDKKIVAADGQTYVSVNFKKDNKLEGHIAIGFEDGSFEINMLQFDDLSKFNKTVYQNKENFGKIKQILFKAGEDNNFFDFPN